MATWYVVSTATGAADGTSEADAFTTIDAALSEPTLAGGDKIWVKATATYDEGGNIDTAGASNNPIEVEGYTTTTGDGGSVTWTNTGGVILTDTPTQNFYFFRNFKFNGGSSHGLTIANNYTFIDCEFTSNNFDGIQSGSSCTFYNCIFANNGQAGQDAGNFARHRYIGCTFYGNTLQAVEGTGSDNAFAYCLFYNNSTSADVIQLSADNTVMFSCTIDGENTTGSLIDAGAEYWDCIVNTILYDGAEGYKSTDTAEGWMSVMANNLTNSNTNNYYDGSAAITRPGFGLNDVTTAPAFTDEANDDYTLGASDAVDAGITPAAS